MNDARLDDLKQFIDSRISQSEARFDQKLDEKIGSLRKEMLDGFSGVGEAIEEIHKQLDKSKDEFDRRLTKLKQQAA